MTPINNPDEVFVHNYTRDDGIEVKEYYRSRPNGGITSNTEKTIKKLCYNSSHKY